MHNPPLRIGLFGVGLDSYWEQFQGLKARLERYLSIVEKKLATNQCEVLNLGLVDNIDKAFEAGSRFRKEEVGIVFIYASTYALSSTVVQVLRNLHVPAIVLNLSPEPAINYTALNAMTDRTAMTAEWLAFCSACPVPEIANLFNRIGIPFHQVTGMLNNDPECWNEIGEWVEAAKVMQTMRYNRLGCMGHYYSGMMDIYTDLTKQIAQFGGHIEIIEVDELSALKNEVTDKSIEARIQDFKQVFDIQPDCVPAELRRAAKTSVALDILVSRYKLGSLAYYYKGSGVPANEDTLSSIILGCSLLTAKGIPVAGEYEIKNAQAMKIMDSFGAGGSFTEFYAMDYQDDVVLMGHDGPGHVAIAEGKIKVRPLTVYHGKVGSGLSVEMSVRNGPVTLLSITETKEGTLMFLVAEAETVAGQMLQIGNTNSRYKFPIAARKFVQEWNSHGPAHHCAVGTGHIASKLTKLAKLLNMPMIQVC
jgi:L-arabinose isomerase